MDKAASLAGTGIGGSGGMPYELVKHVVFPKAFHTLPLEKLAILRIRWLPGSRRTAAVRRRRTVGNRRLGDAVTEGEIYYVVQKGMWSVPVIEVGVSETLGQLYRDAIWWFHQVHYVLLVSIMD